MEVIKNTRLQDLIIANYSKIKILCNNKAFKFYINADDLLSELNNSLMRAVNKNQFIGNEDDFLKYLNLIIHHCAVNVYRGKGIMKGPDRHIDKFVDFENVRDTLSCYTNQPALEEKLFTRSILSWAELNLPTKGKGHFYKVFDLYFLRGHKYEEVATLVGIPVGSVKTIIYKIRELANRHFGDAYNELYKTA